MSFISTYFSYNGIRSEDVGIHLVHMSTGFIESQFWGGRNINYEIVQGNDMPFYYSSTKEPFTLTLQLSPLEGKWTDELKNKVSRWLNNGKFNEFYSTDSINKIYYLTYINSPSLNKTGMNQGYIEVEFMNVDCYVRSPIYEKIFDLSLIGSNSTFIELDNSGSTTMIYPEVWIEKIGDGDLSIKNFTDGARELYFKDLEDKEVIYMDNSNRNVESSIPDRSPTIYDLFNKNYQYFVYGINKLQVTGACKLKFRYRHLFDSQ